MKQQYFRSIIWIVCFVLTGNKALPQNKIAYGTGIPVIEKTGNYHGKKIPCQYVKDTTEYYDWKYHPFYQSKSEFENFLSISGCSLEFVRKIVNLDSKSLQGDSVRFKLPIESDRVFVIKDDIVFVNFLISNVKDKERNAKSAYYLFATFDCKGRQIDGLIVEIYRMTNDTVVISSKMFGIVDSEMPKNFLDGFIISYKDKSVAISQLPSSHSPTAQTWYIDKEGYFVKKE